MWGLLPLAQASPVKVEGFAPEWRASRPSRHLASAQVEGVPQPSGGVDDLWREDNPSFYRKPLHSRFGEATNARGKKSATDTTLAQPTPPALHSHREDKVRNAAQAHLPLPRARR